MSSTAGEITPLQKDNTLDSIKRHQKARKSIPGEQGNENNFIPDIPVQLTFDLASQYGGLPTTSVPPTPYTDGTSETSPDESPPQVVPTKSLLIKENVQKLDDAEPDDRTTSQREDVDTEFKSESLSLPPSREGTTEKASTASQRDHGDKQDAVFTTAVDEQTLDAAKLRNKDRKVVEKNPLFMPEEWGRVAKPNVTADMVIDPQASSHYQKGVYLMNNQCYEKAIVCFNKSINLKPNQAHIYLQRAECFLQLCDFQSAILNFKKVSHMQPSEDINKKLAFVYFFQGQTLFDQYLYQEALEAFTKASEMAPEVKGYHTRCLACLTALDRHGECLALVNNRLDLERDNPDLYIMRARLHDLFGSSTLCSYDVNDALLISPDHPEALKLLDKMKEKAKECKQQAVTLNLMSKHKDALQKITIAIETDPSNAEYHVFRGALYRRLGDFNSAIDDYLLALDKTDHNEESPIYMDAQRQLLLTYNDFAVECFSKEYYEEAVLLLNKAVKGEKREKGLYINRGDCFFRQGELHFALEDYHQALEMDPYDESVRSRISIIHNEFGIAEYQEKQYKEAESRFTLAIQHNPKIGQYYISRCRVRHIQENNSGARQDILFALHLDPQNEEIISLLSRLFPGKSVKDVMDSRIAMAARHALQNAVVTAHPIKLPPLEGGDTNSVYDEDEEGGGPVMPGEPVLPDDFGSVISSKPPTPRPEMKSWSCFPDLKTCMEENDFNIRIVREKQRINNKIKNMYINRQPLRYTSGRVTSLPDAGTLAEKTRPPGTGKSKKKVTIAAPEKNLTWRNMNFTTGIRDVPV